MLKRLQIRLTLLCGIATSFILTVAVILLFYISLKQWDTHTLELFNKSIVTILDEVKYTHMIRYNWLSQMEYDNNIMIYLEDHGQPLVFQGSINPPTDRKLLIEEVKAKALLEGLDISLNPIVSTVTKSSVFNLKKANNEYYRGITIIIPLKQGWRSMILVQYLPDKMPYIQKQFFLFSFIVILGSSMLFILSYLFIGKAIKPVQENQKRQVEFIAAASHELRSPLTVIQAGVSSFKKDSSATHTYLPHVEAECKRLNRLINDMLLLATSDAKTWSLQKSIIDMDTFLIEAYDLLFSFTNANNHTLSLELPHEPLHHVEGDPERLKQLLTILVDNAVYYSPQHKNIILRAYNQKNFVILEVEDHGKGVSDEQKKLVFNRFYRGDSSRTDKKHFGLGLSIAEELVSLHKGKITVQDTVGGGATFVITLLATIKDNL